jgi:serine/threonine protein kinase
LEYRYHPELFEHHLHLPLLPISLASLLEHPLHDELIRAIIYQALSALEHIHSKGIAHRDINPHNIMFDWDGTLKLIDFGIAWAGGDDSSGEDDEVWRECKGEMICSVGTG